MLRETRIVDEAVERLKKERAWLTFELSQIPGVVVIPSDSSFITFKIPRNPASIRVILLARGISVRLVNEIPGLGDCLRVTVAPRPLLEEFLTCIREELA